MRFVRIIPVVLVIVLCLCNLRSYAAVQGYVTDADQNPIQGAIVTFTEELYPYKTFSASTDENGWYEIELSNDSASEDMPFQFNLGQNYPNPFNPSTAIPYSVDRTGHATLTIYNIMGQKVSTLIDNYVTMGNHIISWDGMDDEGNQVSAGVYLYQLKSGSHTKTRKMLLLDGGRSFGAVISKSPASSSPTGTAKLADDVTYTITIGHDSIVDYRETGVSVNDQNILNWVASLIGKQNIIHGITFVAIPGGTFQMGDEIGDLKDFCRPTHTVTVSPFAMSIYEITNAQYAEYLTAKHNKELKLHTNMIHKKSGKEDDFDDSKIPNSNIFFSNGKFTANPETENLPVSGVSWLIAKAFAEFYGFDLPTEAEWEYACRGGKQYLYGTDDGSLDPLKANYNSEQTIEVGSYPPNPFGLFDMCGNVSEWCRDHYYFFTNKSATNPVSLKDSKYRIIKGGSSISNKYSRETPHRSASRETSSYNHSLSKTGFRVVQRQINHTISGRITHNNIGLNNVSIVLDEKATTTASDGTFSFDGIFDGTYYIFISGKGYTYNPPYKKITVKGNDVRVNNIITTLWEDNVPTGLTFAPIPGGTFEMGDEKGDLPDICRPVHSVTVSVFEMGTHEVTNSQYAEYINMALASGDITISSNTVVGAVGKWKGKTYKDLSTLYNRNEIIYESGLYYARPGREYRPVFRVTWYGAKAFAEYYGLDLPTEAEWEYACRGGKQLLYGTKNGKMQTYRYGHSIVVGNFPANPFGLFDMGGNVSEWCADFFADYSSESVTNPVNMQDGEERIIRDYYYGTRPSAYRRFAQPFVNNKYLGFRVVRRPGGLIY